MDSDWLSARKKKKKVLKVISTISLLYMVIVTQLWDSYLLYLQCFLELSSSICLVIVLGVNRPLDQSQQTWSYDQSEQSRITETRSLERLNL